jgi:hypothetical protein
MQITRYSKTCIDLNPVLETVKDASIFTVQCAKDVVNCIECRKPRVVYSKHRLTGRQSATLKALLTEVEYSCGDVIDTPWSTDQTHHNTVYTKIPMTCADAIEIPYYSAELGRKDICCYCCNDSVATDESLLKKFKTVLPLCKTCVDDGCEVILSEALWKIIQWL